MIFSFHEHAAKQKQFSLKRGLLRPVPKWNFKVRIEVLLNSNHWLRHSLNSKSNTRPKECKNPSLFGTYRMSLSTHAGGPHFPKTEHTRKKKNDHPTNAVLGKGKVFWNRTSTLVEFPFVYANKHMILCTFMFFLFGPFLLFSGLNNACTGFLAFWTAWNEHLPKAETAFFSLCLSSAHKRNGNKVRRCISMHRMLASFFLFHPFRYLYMQSWFSNMSA